ncbi:MAG: hypothetical protein AAF368_14450, partial [Planctomycetota bacterium]
GTRIDRWKFDLLRKAILALVPPEGEGPDGEEGIAAMDLPELISEWLEDELDEDQRARLGSVTWYTVAVKLELEVRGELSRVPRARPQRLIRVV